MIPAILAFIAANPYLTTLGTAALATLISRLWPTKKSKSFIRFLLRVLDAVLKDRGINGEIHISKSETINNNLKS